jgi:hypothetical protein
MILPVLYDEENIRMTRIGYRFTAFTLIFRIIFATGCERTGSEPEKGTAPAPYEIYTAEFSDIDEDAFRHVRIEYPQIVHAESHDFEAINRVNALILDGAKNDYENVYQTLGLSNVREYRITRSDAYYLSIVFTGMPYVKETAHPTSECFAVTIDLKKQEICNLASFAPDYDKISDMITEGRYEVENGEFLTFDAYQISAHMEREWGYKGVEPSAHMDDYFLDGERGLAIINRLSHASGDYSIIKFADY